MGEVLEATARLEAAVARLEAAVIESPPSEDGGAARAELEALQKQYAQLEKRTGTVAIRLDKAIARLQKVLEG